MKKIVIASLATLALVTAATAAVNGKACVACHGANWEKHAMGKSKIVAEMTHADIAASLKVTKLVLTVDQ
jgi:cytochrome c-type protein NapB